jgi:hypothetical protein
MTCRADRKRRQVLMVVEAMKAKAEAKSGQQMFF